MVFVAQAERCIFSAAAIVPTGSDRAIGTLHDSDGSLPGIRNSPGRRGKSVTIRAGHIVREGEFVDSRLHVRRLMSTEWHAFLEGESEKTGESMLVEDRVPLLQEGLPEGSGRRRCSSVRKLVRDGFVVLGDEEVAGCETGVGPRLHSVLVEDLGRYIAVSAYGRDLASVPVKGDNLLVLADVKVLVHEANIVLAVELVGYEQAGERINCLGMSLDLLTDIVDIAEAVVELAEKHDDMDDTRSCVIDNR